MAKNQKKNLKSNTTDFRKVVGEGRGTGSIKSYREVTEKDTNLMT